MHRGTLHQLLPTGLDKASIFWSMRHPHDQEVDLDRWREEAVALVPSLEPLVRRVERLLPTSYRDVVVRRPWRATQSGGAVLVGDAAHAMSPQLGTGASLALSDAWSVHQALDRSPDVPTALAAYAQERRRHVRWYQWWSRLTVPAFQSRLTPLAWPRDLIAEPLARIPWVRRQLVTTLMGDRTSLTDRYRLAGHA